MAIYPNALSVFTDKRDASATVTGDHVLASHINNLQNAVSAIEKWLGVKSEYPVTSSATDTVGDIVSRTLNIALTNVPVGTIIAYAGTVGPTTLPPGYLVCDGSPVPADEPGKDYSTLRALLGTSPTVPNLTDRFLKGGNVPGANPSRMDLPEHSHTIDVATGTTDPAVSTTDTDGKHTHAVLTSAGSHAHTLPSILSTANNAMVENVSLTMNFPDLEVRRADGNTFNLKSLNNNPNLSVTKRHQNWLYSQPGDTRGGITTSSVALNTGGATGHASPDGHQHGIGSHFHNVSNKTTGKEGNAAPNVEPLSYSVVYLIRAY